MRRALLLTLVLAGCAAPDSHAPPFARQPYEAFSRKDAVAIALDEWRLWGMRVDDDGGAHYVQAGPTMAERAPGMWQRVGEYWWEGLNAGMPESGWTGKHDAAGREFSVARNGDYAWSAAFISYVMRVAGAGPEFPYAPDHSYYINYAARAARGEVRDPLLVAEDPADYAPRLGDLICFGRHAARAMSFADLPSPHGFPAHCSIVVGGEPGVVRVVGGNVDDAVTAEDLHTNQTGEISGNSEPWFVVLRVMYAR